MNKAIFFSKSTLAALIFCYGMAQAAQVSITVLDKNDKPLEDIVVYVTGDNLMENYEGKEVAVYQEDKKFTPYITVRTPKDTLVFENKDTISHHVFTVLSKELDFRLKRNERVDDQDIPRLGDALLGCNIHDWMAGYVFTVDTPLHSKTNDAGKAIIATPDAGEYTATIWHPQLDKADQSTSLSFNVSNTKALTFKLTNKMDDIPTQDSEELFDFLDDY